PGVDMLVGGAETLQGIDGERHLASWGGDEVDRIVVLCHGLREHVGLYAPLAEALVNGGAQVYALDQAGHGRSEGSPALIDDLEASVDDQRLVLQLARARHPDVPLVLLGQGTGATLAVRLAQHLQANLSALVLAAPLLGTVPGRCHDDPRLRTDPLTGRDLSRDPAVVGRFASDPLVWHGELPIRTAAALHRGLQAIARGPRLRLPVLRLHGDADAIVPPVSATVALRRLIDPGSLIDEIVPGGRHHLLLGTEREHTVPAITGFLATSLRATPTAVA
ncbi:MAG: alpha/beta fold hydrolase, partial [Egicoccus sp.]